MWGDLEQQIPVIVPEKAEQPTGLKAILLPFQQESLSWMRKQENTVWKGGLLAVGACYIFMFRVLKFLMRKDEMG